MIEDGPHVISVEPQDKFTTTWAAIKTQRTLR